MSIKSGPEDVQVRDVLQDTKPLTQIDTLHDDEGVKVLATYSGSRSWDDYEERRLVRKIDRRLLSILCITYGLQYYDKAMIGQAALSGLTTELDLTQGNRYSFASAIFYLGFIAGAYPSSLLAQRFAIEQAVSATVTL